jgi:hypothetical protein
VNSTRLATLDGKRDADSLIAACRALRYWNRELKIDLDAKRCEEKIDPDAKT